MPEKTTTLQTVRGKPTSLENGLLLLFVCNSRPGSATETERVFQTFSTDVGDVVVEELVSYSLRTA